MNDMTTDQLLAELETMLAARRERKMGDYKLVPVTDYESLQAECEKLRKGVGGLVEALKACKDELMWMIERHNEQDQNGGSRLYDHQTVEEEDAAIDAAVEGDKP